MFLQDKINAFADYLRSGEYLENCDIFVAYPYIIKPSKLSRPAIAVSLAETQAKENSLGGEEYLGEYKIDADIFVNLQDGAARASDIAEKVIRRGAELLPCGVYISPVSEIDGISCFRVRCSFTFTYVINFGEDEQNG